MKRLFAAIFAPDTKQSELTHELVKTALAANRVASEKLTEAVEALLADNAKLREASKPCDLPKCQKRSAKA